MTGAGDLRTIVTFQQRTESSDGYGGKAVVWGGDTTVHCHYRAESGRERILSGRIEATASAVLRARAKAVTGVDESWRAVIDGVAWNIRAKIDFGNRGEWVDFTIERAAAGVAV